jgi:hypothetical protein
MAVSARLGSKTQLALNRYCKTHGLTKTQALERGIALLLQRERQDKRHPALASFERIRSQLSDASALEHKHESIETLKRHLDEKYPG